MLHTDGNADNHPRRQLKRSVSFDIHFGVSAQGIKDVDLFGVNMLGYLDAGRNFNQYAADVKPSSLLVTRGLI